MVVLFDFDEVFVDLNTGALRYINQRLGTKYKLQDVTSWEFYNRPELKPIFDDFLAIPDLYQSHVQVHKKMVNILKQMVEMGRSVYIVTASAESSEASKYRFIKEHLSFFDTKNLFTVNASSKYKQKSDVLDELKLDYHQPIVLVDDGIHNILDMMADIKHKERLDGIMKDFYTSRTLKKFNNPYHEFIYGIIPELPYNNSINDGKRIFKIKEPREIWGVLETIKDRHTIRVQNKQAEVFHYLNNIVNELLPAEDFKQANELQNNVSYLAKLILRQNNTHADFLSNIARFSVKVEQVIASQMGSDFPIQRAQEVSKLVLQMIFKSADKKFGSDVMYGEIKSLVILHSAPDVLSVEAGMGEKVSERYGICDRQQDLFTRSIIGSLIEISKENMAAAKGLVQSSSDPKNHKEIETLFRLAGVDYNIDFEDQSALGANALIAFNKNYQYNLQQEYLEIKSEQIDQLKKRFLFESPRDSKPVLAVKV